MQPPADEGALEAALVAAQRGEVAAFDQLVQLYQRQVYNLCYRTLGHADDAADATQEAFFSAYRGIKSYRGPAAGLRGWLIRIAVNACYDQLRRRQRRPADSLDEVLARAEPDQSASPAERLADPSPDPEQHTLSVERAQRIQAALDQLSADQRLAVVLCDVQGLSYEEAAAAMSVELGTAKSRLSRARAHLRDILAAQGELPGTTRRLQERNP